MNNGKKLVICDVKGESFLHVNLLWKQLKFDHVSCKRLRNMYNLYKVICKTCQHIQVDRNSSECESREFDHMDVPQSQMRTQSPGAKRQTENHELLSCSFERGIGISPSCSCSPFMRKRIVRDLRLTSTQYLALTSLRLTGNLRSFERFFVPSFSQVIKELDLLIVQTISTTGWLI